MKLTLKWWWYIAPAYLTAWTLVFSTWNLLDGVGMMSAFGVDIGTPSPFVLLNSASRYVAIGIGMVVGIWVLRTFASILTALLVRFSMDVLDLLVGLHTGLVDGAGGIAQSMLMFLLPGLLAMLTLRRASG